MNKPVTTFDIGFSFNNRYCILKPQIYFYKYNGFLLTIQWLWFRIELQYVRQNYMM